MASLLTRLRRHKREARDLKGLTEETFSGVEHTIAGTEVKRDVSVRIDASGITLGGVSVIMYNEIRLTHSMLEEVCSWYMGRLSADEKP